MLTDALEIHGSFGTRSKCTAAFLIRQRFSRFSVESAFLAGYIPIQAMQKTGAVSKPVLTLSVLAGVIAVACWLRLFEWRDQVPVQTPSILTGDRTTALVRTNLNGTNVSGEIATTAQALRLSNDREESLKKVDGLRRQLGRLDKDTAALAIQGWLDSSADAQTHLGFSLSPDGRLKEAPTLRLFLLDYLIQVAPQAAGAYAEKILRAPSSPDEWAVSLRAYALAYPTHDAKAYLQRKVREMIGMQDWRDNPSAGFLEAFDVLVYTRDIESTPQLADWVRQPANRGLAHAAYLTLDRLVQAEPAEVLEQLHSHPDLLEGREGTRADFFARADVRDPRQRQVLENYLLDPNRSAGEVHKFAATYPNANYVVSYNLLTRSRTPTRDEIAARDREALRAVQEWMGDARFASVRPQLQVIRNGLEQFVKLPAQGQP
jgi:hypothetical protein